MPCVNWSPLNLPSPAHLRNTARLFFRSHRQWNDDSPASNRTKAWSVCIAASCLHPQAQMLVRSWRNASVSHSTQRPGIESRCIMWNWRCVVKSIMLNACPRFVIFFDCCCRVGASAEDPSTPDPRPARLTRWLRRLMSSLCYYLTLPYSKPLKFFSNALEGNIFFQFWLCRGGNKFWFTMYWNSHPILSHVKICA